MELALIIIAGVGALLFILGYLAYVLGGFKHHFVTGIIAVLPVLNIVTLPSLLHKSRGKLVVSIIGLVMFVASWFLGANKSLPNLISGKKGLSSEEVILSSNSNEDNSTSQGLADSQSKVIDKFDSKNMVVLPSKALYNMSFETIPTNKINSLQGRIVQVTLSNNEVLEGRLQSVNAGSFFIEGNIENELPIGNIKELKLMVKKAKP